MSGIFNDRFDRNNDGVLDSEERMEKGAYEWYVNNEYLKNRDEDETDFFEDEDEYDEDDVEIVEVVEDEDAYTFGSVFADENELQEAGLDAEELEFMDPWDRRGVLEDAGLDPDDFDF